MKEMRKARRQGGKYETKKYWHVYLIVNCHLWYLCITDDTNEMSGENDLAGGGMALLLTIVTCNIYGWYWAYKMGEKVDIIKNRNGMPSSNSGILFVVLQFLGLGIINYALAQDAVNKYSGTTGYNQPYNGGYQNQQYGAYNQNQQPYNGGSMVVTIRAAIIHTAMEMIITTHITDSKKRI